MTGAADPLAESAFARAQALGELGRWSDAADAVRELLVVRPDHGQAWCLLGQSQLRTKDFEAALRAADTAATFIPDDDWPHRLRSTILETTGQIDDAIAAARTAAAIAPNRWEALVRLASTLRHRRREWPEAIAVAQQAITIAPSLAMTHIAAGNAATVAGRWGDADRAYRRAAELDPALAQPRLGQARMLRRHSWLGRPDLLGRSASVLADIMRSWPKLRNPRGQLGVTALEAVLRVSVLLDAAVALGWALRSQEATGALLTTSAAVAVVAWAGIFAWAAGTRALAFLRTVLKQMKLRATAASLGLVIVLLVSRLGEPRGVGTVLLALASPVLLIAQALAVVALRRVISRVPRIDRPAKVLGRLVPVLGVAALVAAVAVPAGWGSRVSAALATSLAVAAAVTAQRHRNARGQLNPIFPF